LIDALIWFITVEFLSLIFLPVTFFLFKNLPDRGYAFGKALSILFVSFILWILSNMHVLPNEQWAIILIVVLLAAGSSVLFRRRRSEIKEYVAQNRGVIIATEAVFISAFILYSVIRSHNPEIAGTEKPMDFAFLNAIMRTDYFPPQDPWLSGFNINNYYFGHMMMATLTKFTGISTAVSFNLSLALIFALAAAGSFSIVYNLVKLCHKGSKSAIGFGIIAAVFLLILGNLEGALEMGYAHGAGSQGFWSWVNINGLQNPYHSGSWYPSEWWWWWHASRVISPVGGIDTITEFPYFSFLLGDMHAHILAMPFVLLSLAVILNLFAAQEPIGLGWLKKNIAPFILIVICIGSLGAIHTWDLPIYLFIFVAVIWIQTRIRHGMEPWWKSWGLIGVITVAGAILFYLPFYLNMNSPISGISLWKGPDARLLHQIIIWGLFLFIGVSFLVAQSRGILKSSLWRVGAITFGVSLFLWIAWAVAVAATGGGVNIGIRFAYSIPPIVLLTMVVLIAFKEIKKENANISVIFALLLIFTGLLLVYGCGLFYVNDGWFGRMNTVFRFYYQSWILFAIASAFGLYYICRHWQVSRVRGYIIKSCWWFTLTLLLLSALLYPIASTWSRTNAFSSNPTLDGLAYLKVSNPSEYEAIAWINDNVDGTPVILEAVGGVYSNYGRVSELTGLPTVLGWEQHERHWRGWTEPGSDTETQMRRSDVNLVYQSDDVDQVKVVLEKYGVTFVYVGDLERSSYGEDVGAGFVSYMDVVFENDGVTIYRVRD
jgi:YYY domain-containing protein